MTTEGHSESKRNVYDACDPQYLRQLREAAGMDLFVLAKKACLSVAQVRQLETDDRDNLFYSDAIKRQSYKRVLMILGAEPPSVEVPQELRDPGKVAQAHLDTLDQIVAMSEQPSMNRTAKDVMRDSLDVVKSNKQLMAALLLLMGAVVLFVLSEPQNNPPAVEASQPPKASAALAAAVATAASAVATVASMSAPAVVASAPEKAVPAIATSAALPPLAAPQRLSACAYSNDAMPQLSSLFAQKETRYVYLVGTVNAEICVVDANKEATLVQLKAGESRSVYGVAPWQISGTQLQKTQIYFQGTRVSVPDNIAHQFKLTELPLSR